MCLLQFCGRSSEKGAGALIAGQVGIDSPSGGACLPRSAYKAITLSSQGEAREVMPNVSHQLLCVALRTLENASVAEISNPIGLFHDASHTTRPREQCGGDEFEVVVLGLCIYSGVGRYVTFPCMYVREDFGA